MYSFGITLSDYRYNPENLLVVAITPGPKESTCDELQHLIEIVVDDKIHLFNNGITVQTQKYPQGKSIYLYLNSDANN